MTVGWAWVVFAVLGGVSLAFGLGDIASGGSTFVDGEHVMFEGVTGMTWAELESADPGAANLIDSQVRASGVWLAMLGAFVLAIAAIPLRQGARWAWLVMWVFPVGVAGFMALLSGAIEHPESGIPIPIMSGGLTLVIAVPTLILSGPRYLRGAASAEAGDSISGDPR
jgi:hypothetical protein